MSIEQTYFTLAERVNLLESNARGARKKLDAIHTILAFPGEHTSACDIAHKLDQQLRRIKL